MFGKKRVPLDKPNVAAENAIGAADPAENAIGAAELAKSAVSDTELAAVITAAVMAYRSETAVCDIVYRKIDRTAGPRTAWNLAGLREVLTSRSI
jgi:hypothetical protein